MQLSAAFGAQKNQEKCHNVLYPAGLLETVGLQRGIIWFYGFSAWYSDLKVQYVGILV